MVFKPGDNYWDAVREWAKVLNSDGCSGPTLPVYVDACYEHDIHYRTHRTLVPAEPGYKGEVHHGYRLSDYQIDRKFADDRIRDRMREMSPLDGCSPMAEWRWLALRAFGASHWSDDDKGTPIHEKGYYMWPKQEQS